MRPTAFSTRTFGRIYREIYNSKDAAIAAARRLLSHRGDESSFGVRVLDGAGQQVWSSIGEGG